MNRLLLAAVATLAVACAASRAVALDVLPTARDDNVLGQFQARCLREEPVYDRLEQQAEADKMVNLGDHSAPGADGATVEGHRWGGKLPDGPYALYLSKVTDKASVETSCGVSGTVPSADHFRDGFVRSIALPGLPEPSFDTKGSATYVWSDFPSVGHRLILQTKTGKDGHGFVLATMVVRRAPQP